MRRRHYWFMAVAFFCLCGWVCNDPALGADEATEATDAPAAGVFTDATPPAQPAAPAKDEALLDGQTIRVGAFNKIDLHIKDIEVTQVLQMLALQAERNIVASRSVTGTLSANLFGVDFYEALDALLLPNGFGYYEKGSFIYVHTADEMAAIQESERKQISRIVRLNYLTSEDATAFIKPLLSAAGQLTSLGSKVPETMVPSDSDNGTNTSAHADTIMIRDYEDNVEQIVAVIKELDVRPKQVLIESTILEARLTDNTGWGTDLSILLDDYHLGQKAGSPLNVVDSLISGNIVDGGSVVDGVGTGQGIQTTVGNTAGGDSGFKFGVVGTNVAAFVRALDCVTDTTVIAKPKLLVLNRQRAQLLVGAKLGYLSTTTTETSSTQDVEFLETGTSLVVRPFVGEDGFVRLELKPSVSDGEVVGFDGQIIPNETTNELTTNVIVRSGQTVVLGGLFKEDTTVSRNQVPFIGDVPVIGAAMRGQDDSTDRTEVIFLVTPTVLKDRTLYAGGEDGSDRVEQLRMGSRTGLLPWSRDKLTAAKMREAAAWKEAGETRRALWAAQQAIDLDPRMEEAIDFRQELGEDLDRQPNRSLLRGIVDTMVQEQAQDGEGVVGLETVVDPIKVEVKAKPGEMHEASSDDK